MVAAMPSFRVIEHVDVSEDVSPRMLPGVIYLSFDAFAFQ
jgi:hypothetical protein